MGTMYSSDAPPSCAPPEDDPDDPEPPPDEPVDDPAEPTPVVEPLSPELSPELPLDVPLELDAPSPRPGAPSDPLQDKAARDAGPRDARQRNKAKVERAVMKPPRKVLRTIAPRVEFLSCGATRYSCRPAPNVVPQRHATMQRVPKRQCSRAHRQ